MFQLFAISVCFVQLLSGQQPPACGGARRDSPCDGSRLCQVQFENDRVRALHASVAGNVALCLYDAPDTLFICLDECHLRLERLSGQLHDMHMESGEIRWIPAYLRRIRNLHESETSIVLVEVKHRAGAGIRP